MAPGIRERFHRPAAPRSHRDPSLLGHAFRGDLVAQPPDYLTIRTNEHDAEIAAKVRKFGVLGHETPSHPRCLRASGHQRPFQPAIVDVTAFGLMAVRVDDLRFT